MPHSWAPANLGGGRGFGESDDCQVGVRVEYLFVNNGYRSIGRQSCQRAKARQVGKGGLALSVDMAFVPMLSGPIG